MSEQETSRTGPGGSAEGAGAPDATTGTGPSGEAVAVEAAPAGAAVPAVDGLGTAGAAVVRSAPVRWMWFAAGWIAVGIGSIGVVVPGLPTTVFFIVAASCFARSSPRFERWVLGLPRVGRMVQDHRAGLGMPRRAKAWAIGMIVLFAGASAVLSIDRPVIAGSIAALGLVGIAYILWRVPTREDVLAQAGGTGGTGASGGTGAAGSSDVSSPVR